MTNWIKKLDDYELTELFKYAFDFKDDEIGIKTRDSNSEWIIFVEKWGNGTEDFPYEWLDTHYEFENGGLKLDDSSDVQVTYDCHIRYTEWIIKRFGKEFIAELVEHEFGVGKQIVLENMK